MKVSNDFANVRSHIIMMDNLPNLPQAYIMLLQEQRHRDISKMPSIVHEPVAFAMDRFQNQFRQQANAQYYTKGSNSGKFFSNSFTNNFSANPVKPK